MKFKIYYIGPRFSDNPLYIKKQLVIEPDIMDSMSLSNPINMLFVNWKYMYLFLYFPVFVDRPLLTY